MSKHIVLRHSKDRTNSESSKGPDFSPTDFPGWESLSCEAAGLFMFQFRIQPGAAEYPLHASPDEWMAYVATGGGVLLSGTEAGEITGETAFSAGDIITFGADTRHGWQAGDEETVIVLVRTSEK